MWLWASAGECTSCSAARSQDTCSPGPFTCTGVSPTAQRPEHSAPAWTRTAGIPPSTRGQWARHGEGAGLGARGRGGAEMSLFVHLNMWRSVKTTALPLLVGLQFVLGTQCRRR